jgi:hypothetical protein
VYVMFLRVRSEERTKPGQSMDVTLQLDLRRTTVFKKGPH